MFKNSINLDSVHNFVVSKVPSSIRQVSFLFSTVEAVGRVLEVPISLVALLAFGHDPMTGSQFPVLPQCEYMAKAVFEAHGNLATDPELLACGWMALVPDGPLGREAKGQAMIID